jgi:hypothetical protein
VLNDTLRPLARLLLWDYERGSLAYYLACLAILAVLFLAPADLWADPLNVAERQIASFLR